MVLRVEHIVACKLGCKCKRKRGWKRQERQGDRKAEKERGAEKDGHETLLREPQKFNLAKRCSAVNLGARTGLKYRAWRSLCSARHKVKRDMSSELCRRSMLRVCRGASVTATSISARTSLVRRRFSGRDPSGAPRPVVQKLQKLQTRERSKAEIKNCFSNHHHHHRWRVLLEVVSL